MDLKELSKYRCLKRAMHKSKKNGPKYQELKTTAEKEKKKIIDYIDKLPDESTQQLFKMRFIYCYSWVKVAMEHGGNNSADNCKKIVYRMILSQKKKMSLF